MRKKLLLMMTIIAGICFTQNSFAAETTDIATLQVGLDTVWVLLAAFFVFFMIDDPVGAFPVHGMNGIWGTLSIGIFGQKALGLAADGLLYGGGFHQLGVQELGVTAASLFAIAVMGLVFYMIKITVGLRVTKDEEIKGLDIGDGKIFVIELAKCIRIRTGESGNEAIG